MKALRIIFSAIFVVAALMYVNAIVPKPQSQATVTAYYNSDVCGNLKVLNPAAGSDITESPSCTAGGSATSHVNSYQTSVTVYNSSDHDIKGNFGWDEYWCNYDSGNSCGGSGNPKETTYHRTNGPDTIPAHSSVTFKSSDNHPTGDGLSFCGVYQHDFTFSYQDGNKSCGPGNPSTGKSFYTMDWGVCRAGTGTDANCHAAPQHHNVCENNACVQKDGPGDTTCSTQNDCSHLSCQDNSCVRVTGKGQDSCTAEGSSCGEIQHLACQNNACVLVPGAGQPQCTTEPDSCKPYHNVCQNQACVRVEGIGNDSCRLDSNDCQTPHLTVIKIVNNNHGGTKSASDFMLHVSNGSGDVADSPAAGSSTGKTYTIPAGNYTVSEDDPASLGYHKVSISGDCDASGNVSLINGTTKTCVIENEDNGGGACTMPSCNTNISGCSYPYPDTKSCSCGPLVCITQTPSQPNITINVHQEQQQQQQQAVLGASVAPAVSSNQLPRTGSGTEILLTLLGLLPIGLKLRKFV